MTNNGQICMLLVYVLVTYSIFFFIVFDYIKNYVYNSYSKL